jgi:hypothetical protein
METTFAGEVVTVSGSSNVRSVAYDREQRIMRVEYANGAYGYRNFPVEEWELVKGSKYIGQFIAGRFQSRHPAYSDYFRFGGLPTRGSEKTSGPVQEALKNVKAALKKNGRLGFMYCVWLACGSPNTSLETTTGAKLYKQVLATISTASGLDKVGREYLDAAIRLAAEKGI